jgi:hypothetical protein
MAALQTFGMPSRRKKSPLERGERVYLRQPTAADAKEVTVTVRASRDLHRPWVYPTETKTAFDGYIRRTKERDYVGLLICRNSDDAAHCRVTRGARASPFWLPRSDAGIVQALLSTNTQLLITYDPIAECFSHKNDAAPWRCLEVKKKKLERDYNNDKNKNYNILEGALCRHIVGSFSRRKLIVFRRPIP